MVALKCCIRIVRLHELHSFAYTPLSIAMQCLQPVHVMLAGPQGTVLLCVLSMRCNQTSLQCSATASKWHREATANVAVHTTTATTGHACTGNYMF